MGDLTSSRSEGAPAAQAAPASSERLRQVIRKLEETNRAQQVVMEASRAMLLARDERELIDLFAGAVRRLFPGRRFAVRIVDPRTLEVSSQRWEGPHAPSPELRLKRSAVEKMGLSEALEGSEGVEVLDRYEPVFAGSATGLAMPLVAAGQLFGLVNLEYAAGEPDRREEDGLLLRPLANQVSLILRNVKLLSESLYLKEYLEKLIEAANALIVVLDRERRVRVFNREIERLTGYRKAEVLGTVFGQLLPEEERPRLLRVLINAVRGVPTTAFETRLRKKDGGEIRVSFNTASILGPGGAVEGVIAVGQDLTQIRALEQQVLHAERLATVGQLAAGVVHELNNPLTSISVYGEYLRKKLQTEGTDPADVEKARKIVEASERIRQFARDLMSYARPSGSTLVQLQVNDVVRQSISFCEHLASAAGARVECALAPDLPRVVGVPSQLQQVFINLLTNAFDAVAEEGGGKVEVVSTVREGAVEVAVRDEGPGIGEADRPHVFEPFFTTKPPGKGTGLGLSIVKEIVEAHGGTVSFEGGPDRGTLFRVTLPAGPRAAG